MPRVLTLKTEERVFEVPIRDIDEESKSILRTDHEGFCQVKGTDGQVVVVHRSRIEWIHVKQV